MLKHSDNHIADGFYGTLTVLEVHALVHYTNCVWSQQSVVGHKESLDGSGSHTWLVVIVYM